MKVLTINNLSLKNFKGISNLDINFEGKDMSVSSANGLGKTTIIDAIHWLRQNAHSNEVVLAAPNVSLWIPAYTGIRVFYAHPDQTLDAATKYQAMKRWYRESAADSSWCEALLRGATEVVPREKIPVLVAQVLDTFINYWQKLVPFRGLFIRP